MATTSEYNDLEEAAKIALRLRKKDSDGEDRVEIYAQKDIPIMVAMVSHKSIEHPNEERKINPHLYNHPVFLCSPKVVQDISRLPKLTPPNSSRPSLLETSPLFDPQFRDPDTPEIFVPTTLSRDHAEVSKNIVHDVLHGYLDDAVNLHAAASAECSNMDDKYEHIRRGRSHYVNTAPEFDCDRPIAYQAHTRHRRAHSLPPSYDRTLQAYDLDPFNSSISDKDEHKGTLIDSLRRTSEEHILHPGPSDIALRKLGLGDGTYSEKDVYVECYKFAFQRQNIMNQDGKPVNWFVPQNVPLFRDYLKHSPGIRFDVTTAIINTVLFPGQAVVSAGKLFFVEIDEQPEEDRQAIESKQPKLNVPAPNPEDLLRRDKARARGRYKPLTLHDRLANKEKAKQDKSANVRLKWNADKSVKQYARIQIIKPYVDSSRPNQTLHHEAHVNITDRNARREPYIPSNDTPSLPFHEDAIALYNVSSEAYQPRLEQLYQHVVKDDPEYFARLQTALRGGATLWLMSTPHNNVNWSSNLNSCDPNQPELLTAFKVALAAQPQIFILFRASETSAIRIRDSIRNRFTEQQYYDPLPDQLLVEPASGNPYTPSSFKSIAEVRSIHCRVEPSFQDWADYELRVAAGANYEATWASTDGRTLYNGSSVLLPVQKTFDAKQKVYLVYAGAITLSPESLKNPSLQKGDRLKVWIDVDDIDMVEPWLATVSGRFSWAGLDQICFYVTRPTEQGEMTDLRTLHFLNDIDGWSLAELQQNVKKVRQNKIAAQFSTDEKELKRKLKTINNMRLSTGLEVNDPAHEKSLQDSQHMFMANDHAALPRSSLYSNVVLDSAVMNNVFSGLDHDQDRIVTNLTCGGMINGTAVVTGVSGSGKSLLLRRLGLPYIGALVKTESSLNVKRNLELSYLQLPKDSRPNVHNPKDADYQNPQPRRTDLTRPAFIETMEFEFNTDHTILEKGRSLYVAATNETADALYKAVHRDAMKLSTSLNRPPPLVYRRFAKSTEISAIKAMLECDIGSGVPHTFKTEIDVLPDGHNDTICKEYSDFYLGSRYSNIRDARFTDIESSMAYKVYQLSLPENLQDHDIQAAFARQERDIIRQQLGPLHEVQAELLTTGQWTKELIKSLSCCKTGFDWLDNKADVVVATTSAATEERFVRHRQPHFIGIEEFGRLDDTTAMSFFSMYPSAYACVCVGDYRQIGVQLFGNKDANPMFHQTKYSFLSRLIETGFHVPDLKSTKRFGNEELLDLVRAINKDPSIKMSQGAERAATSQRIRDLHSSLYSDLKVSTTCLYLNYAESDQDASKSSNGSYRNMSTALLAINHTLKLVTHGIRGLEIVITSPYKTQTEVHRSLLIAASKTAEVAIAAEVAAVRCSTIDSYMGEESFYIVHDTCSRTGHAYSEVARSAVLFSRATVGFTIIGSNAALLSHKDAFKYDHACKETMRSLIRTGRYVNLSPGYTS